MVVHRRDAEAPRKEIPWFSRRLSVSAVMLLACVWARLVYYNQLMTRRELLALGAACAPALWARSHIDRSSLSAITDEIGLTLDESIAFAHQYGLKNVEIRSRKETKKEYF